MSLIATSTVFGLKALDHHRHVFVSVVPGVWRDEGTTVALGIAVAFSARRKVYRRSDQEGSWLALLAASLSCQFFTRNAVSGLDIDELRVCIQTVVETKVIALVGNLESQPALGARLEMHNELTEAQNSINSSGLSIL